jgi:hypothetical protein
MRRIAILLLLAISSPALSRDLVVIERASPGLNPAMKTSWVSLYNGELDFVSTLRGYPLASGGTPSAALMVGSSLFVAEARCTEKGCAPRVVRHHADGHSVTFPRPTTRVTSIRLSARGELVVATEKEILRLDRSSGAVLSEHAPPLPASSFIADLDVDRSGCGIAAATMYPNVIVRGDLCASWPGWTMISIPGSPPDGLRGIRFLRDGSLLAGTRTIYHLARDGAILRGYEAGESGGCLVEVDEIAPVAILACESYLLHLDLQSGELSERKWIRNGIAFQALTVVEPEPPPRRRLVRR